MRPLEYAVAVVLLAVVAGAVAYAVYPLAGDDAVLASGTSVLPGVASVGRISGHVVVEGVVEQRGFVEVDGRRYPVIVVRGDDGGLYRVVLGARALESLPGDAETVILGDVMMEHRVRVVGVLVDDGLVIAHGVEMMCGGAWMGVGDAMARGCMPMGVPGPMGGHGMPWGGPGR